MEQEKIITLDLTGCKYLGELHQRIKKAFDFPDFYEKTGMRLGICFGASVMQIR